MDIEFAGDVALGELKGLDLLRRQQERLFVSPLDEALVQLHRVLDDFFPAKQSAAAR